jgi:hypothetical protein
VCVLHHTDRNPRWRSCPVPSSWQQHRCLASPPPALYMWMLVEVFALSTCLIYSLCTVVLSAGHALHSRFVRLCGPHAVLPCQLFNSCSGRQVRSALLAWYDTHHRVLPWRRNASSRRSPPAPGEPQPAPADLPAGVFAYWVWVCEARPAAAAAKASADMLRCFLARSDPSSRRRS